MASASDASAWSSKSSSTRSVPSGRVTNSTSSDRRAGASAVATASHSRGRGTPWMPVSARAGRVSSGGGAPPAKPPSRASRSCRLSRRQNRTGYPTPAGATLRLVRRRLRGNRLVCGLAEPLRPVALDLTLEVVDEEVDRGLHVARALARPEVRPLREDGGLGDVAVGDRRVLLDAEL